LLCEPVPYLLLNLIELKNNCIVPLVYIGEMIIASHPSFEVQTAALG
jgi:hypothetical protein